MGHSSSSQHKSTSKSQPAVDEPSQVENTPARLVSLPRLLIVDPSHFIVDGTTITRSTFGLNWQPSPIESPLFIEKAITEGVVSVTLTILALFEIKETEGIHLGLFDSTASLSLIEDSMKRGYDQRLGCDVFRRNEIVPWFSLVSQIIGQTQHRVATLPLRLEEWGLCADGGEHGLNTSNAAILREWRSWI